MIAFVTVRVAFYLRHDQVRELKPRPIGGENGGCCIICQRKDACVSLRYVTDANGNKMINLAPKSHRSRTVHVGRRSNERNRIDDGKVGANFGAKTGRFGIINAFNQLVAFHSTLLLCARLMRFTHEGAFLALKLTPQTKLTGDNRRTTRDPRAAPMFTCR